MTQTEFEALLADVTKRIEEDISWIEDEDHSPGVEFRIQVVSDPGFPLFVKGWYNREVQTLSYALIHRGVGRIYGLDLGRDHHNPSAFMLAKSISTVGAILRRTRKLMWRPISRLLQVTLWESG